ncbi:MAG: DUF3887 domain-containing protein [bacterium]|mgnify:CR=1 FL=1|nr:DUF3887 domain-containing protein [bacterium]
MKTRLLSGILIVLFLFSCSSGNSSDLNKSHEELGREFVITLSEKRYDDAVTKFDPVMKVALSKSKLKEAWETNLQTFGSFEKIESISQEPYQSYEIVTIKSEFNKNGQISYLDIKITYDSKKRIAGLFFISSSGPKDFEKVSYIDPGKFTEKDVVFGEKDLELPGTLTIPTGSGPFPVLILVHGSGPNDRDETLGPNKPFKDIAWGLGTKGIAVFRYDKRTKVYSETIAKDIHNLTVKEETVNDVISAVKFLKNNEQIDTDAIYVLGHSLGGSMIPRIASLTEIPAGYVIMAGTPRKLEELIIEQIEYISNADGECDAKEKKQIEDTKKVVEKIKQIQKEKRTEKPEIILGASNKYWIDFDEYNICETAKKITKPVFIIQGERDYQVTMKDFEIWKKCLDGKKNVVFKSYPALNHLFMSGDGMSVPEEYMKSDHVAEDVISDLFNWIEENRKR